MGGDDKKFNMPDIDYANLPDQVCDECGFNVFRAGVQAKQLSAIQSRTGKKSSATRVVALCAKCNAINLHVHLNTTK